METKEIIDIILSCSALISSIITLLYMIFGFNKKQNQYLKKQESIFKSLEVLDDYFSMKKYDGIMAVRKTHLSKEELVLREREIYSLLIVTCSKKDVPQKFMDLITTDKTDLKEIHKYRELCRKELGLKSIPINEDKIYIIK